MPGVAPDSASTDSPRQPLQPGVDGVSLDMNTDASLKNRKGGALGSGSHMGSKSSFRLAFPWSQQDGAGRANKYAYADEVDNFKVWLDKTRDSGSKAIHEYTAFDWAALFLPCLTWLRTYKIKEYLMWDIIAGVSVGIMVVPQGMSYAGIAGVPAVWGLYGAFVPVLVYALFGSSRQLGVGPVAVTSLLIGSGVAGLVPGADEIIDHNNPAPDQVATQEAYNLKVTQLAFVVACLYTGIGTLRLGFLVRFLSHSVITGFTSGAACIIALTQVQYLMGVRVKRRVDPVHEQIKALVEVGGGFKWQEFVMGMSLLIFLQVLKYLSTRYKKRLFWLRSTGPLLVSVIGILAVKIGNLDDTIRTVKSIPSGMPSVTIGHWAPIADVGPLLGLAAIVMVVDLLESTSIARALARKNKYELHYNREIVGLGIANFMGAAFNAYTTTGSFSRSAVNNESGAKTQLAGFITGLVVMLVLLLLTPVLALLPYNVTAAIVITSVIGLIEYEHAIFLFKTNLRDFFVWLVAFCGTIFLGVELGLAISIGIALLIVIFESAFPHTAILGRVERTNVYRNLEQYPNAELVPGVLVVRLDAPIYFANVQWFQDKIAEYEKQALKYALEHGASGIDYLIIDLTPVNHLDSMGVSFIEDMITDYRARGIQVLLSNPNARVVRMLERAGVIQKLGRDWIFVRVHDAVTFCKANLMMEGGDIGQEQ